jgi:hypothetical protein
VSRAAGLSGQHRRSPELNSSYRGDQENVLAATAALATLAGPANAADTGPALRTSPVVLSNAHFDWCTIDVPDRLLGDVQTNTEFTVAAVRLAGPRRLQLHVCDEQRSPAGRPGLRAHHRLYAAGINPIDATTRTASLYAKKSATWAGWSHQERRGNRIRGHQHGCVLIVAGS